MLAALGDIDFTKVTEAYARAYVDLVVEPTGRIEKHHIGDAVWRNAINYARSKTPSQPKGTSQCYDIGVLFPKVNTTAGLLNVLQPVPYTAAKGAAFPNPPAAPATATNDWKALVGEFLETFMRSLTENATPGVVVQALSDAITASGGAALTTSGVAVVTRGCFLYGIRDLRGGHAL